MADDAWTGAVVASEADNDSDKNKNGNINNNNNIAVRRRDIIAKSSSSLPQQSRSASDEEPDRAKSRLGQVKSLDAASGDSSLPQAADKTLLAKPTPDSSSADDRRRSSVESSTPPKPSGTRADQTSKQRQMFSLRQLTLSKTRNLTGRKQAQQAATRGDKLDKTSLATNASKTQQQDHLSTDSNSNSHSNSADETHQAGRGVLSRASSARKGSNGASIDCVDAAYAASSDEEAELNDEEGLDEEESDEEEEESYSDEDEEEACSDDEENAPQHTQPHKNPKHFSDGFLLSGDEISAQTGCQTKIRLTPAPPYAPLTGGGHATLQSGTTCKRELPPSAKRRISAASGSSRRRRRRLRERRRASLCQCEPITSRLDHDCLPVTDVDLASYKHLCQMEQRQQQLMANQQRRGRRNYSNLNLNGDEAGLICDGSCSAGLPVHSDKLTPLSMVATQASYNSLLSQPTAFGGRGCHRTATQHSAHASRMQRCHNESFRGEQPLNRRLSLQEESGAYYELCVSSEERQIRAKYVWFPPALKTLQLVDQFFSYFPKDKIPYSSAGRSGADDGEACGNNTTAAAAAATTTTKSTAGQAQIDSKNVCMNKQQQIQPSEGQVAQQHPQEVSSESVGQALACSSYRDEQISLQLPRQDISLDYCSYHMNEASRSSYLQFVDKRNSHSLDVGTIVQIKPVSGQTGASTCATTINPARQQQQVTARRLSNANQQRGLLCDINLNQLACNAPATSTQQAGGQQQVAGSQRCRRCLIRFEPGQLAVVAPNFALGTGYYHNQLTRGTGPAAAFLDADSAPQVSSAVSRRSSVGLQSQPTPSSGGLPLAEHHQDRAQTPAKPNSAMFHPNCFTCSTCKEFLVDLVYCLRDGKLYCLRHYGESLRPRCSWCQELIFSDEYLKAMNENFHVDHFLCRHCDSNLAGQRYVLKEEKPYCIGCYEDNFANTCEDCQKPIGIDSRDLSYKDRHWHDTCFLCQQCQQSLIDKPFGSKGDKVYCADCYDTTFATRCDGCKNPFRAGSKKMEYRGRQWHDSCFCCCVCLNTIGSNSFIPKNEEIYCIKCYEDKYATRCTKCKQVIVSGGVTFRNEPWHRECFNCCNCNKSLAGQRFTTKDLTNNSDATTNSGNPLNKTNQPHNAYCIDCYGELFAKKCFACTQAITGLGGTRFVTFEDRSWHNDCFICNDCQVSLVGKGFITDGPDTILCGDCARAKLR